MTVPKALLLAPARSEHRRTPLAFAGAGAGLAPWLIGAIAFCLVLQGWLAFTRQINWDEFYFLTHIYEYRRGDLHSVMQTFYVHLFTWLPLVSPNTINEIVFARFLMLGLEAGTLGLIYSSARRFVSRDAALLGSLSYTSFIYVFIHGASFRADPIATFLLMAGVALLLAPQLSWKQTVPGACAVALAGLITIKAAFFLPIFAGIALWQIAQSDNRPRLLQSFGIGFAVSAVLFASLFLLHRASVSPAIHAALGDTAATDFGIVFAADAFNRTWIYLDAAILDAPITFACLALGIAACIWNIARAKEVRAQASVLLAFSFPLTTLFFYRNSFPYYYPFVLAPAALLIAYAFEHVAWLRTRWAWAAGFVVCLLLQVPASFAADQSAQRATLDAVHAMFPKPVPHIGRCGMVSDYPRTGFFMSSWGIEAYRAIGKPMFRDAIATDAPLFVVTNTPVLQEALVPGSTDVPESARLLDADARALRENYVHHWGDIWVAGKTFSHLNPNEERKTEVAIPGRYTVESSSPIFIDDKSYAPSSVVKLSRGPHRIHGTQPMQNAILRWGDHLMRPAAPPPAQPIFEGF